MTTVILYAIALTLLIISFIKDRVKTKESMKIALKTFINTIFLPIFIIFELSTALAFSNKANIISSSIELDDNDKKEYRCSKFSFFRITPIH